MTATIKDFRDLIKLLPSFELQELYQELGIAPEDVQKAEQNAPGKTVNLKAMAVLDWWKKSNPTEATRDTLLTALEECIFLDQKRKLEDKWRKYNRRKKGMEKTTKV